MRAPRIFVASSVESLDVADAINVNFDHQAEVTVWKHGFKISQNTIDSLIEMAETVDFAIFVFTPDDLVTIKAQSKSMVRDNVLYELGLFTGTLGKERCFIIKPRNTDLHFPTDLLGLTPADYNGDRTDGNIEAAINHPSVLIKKRVKELGLVSKDLDVQKKKRRKTGYSYTLGMAEHRLLTEILSRYADDPDGASVWNIMEGIRGIEKSALSLASIKLERMGYIDRGISANMNHEFYIFSITADGIDYLIDNEELLLPESTVLQSTNYDDDIPF